MTWYEYAVIAVALFFAGSWAFGLVFSARNRTGGNIATVILWWVAIALVLAEAVAPIHLLWIFPVSLVVPALLLFSRGRL